MSEQIRRAIADWIAKRGSIPSDPVYDGLQAIAAMPGPVDPKQQKLVASVKRLGTSLRKTLGKERELAAIARGERTDKEAERFYRKAFRRPVSPRRKA